MSGETTYALIQSWLPDIVEATEFYLMRNTFMPGIVQVFTDQTGDDPRRADKYVAGSVVNGTEGVDFTAWMAFNRSAFGTITPAEKIGGWFLTDDRVESDNVENIVTDMGEHIGQIYKEQLDTDLFGAFSSFTGGSVGTAGGSMTWELLFAAKARLRAAGAPGPYNCVLHEYAWYDLGTARSLQMPLVVEPALRAANSFYVGSFGDINFYTTGLITAGTAVLQGLFSRGAVALDIRAPLRIEPQRDASKRGTEYVTRMKYGSGVWRADYGCKIVSDATAP